MAPDGVLFEIEKLILQVAQSIVKASGLSARKPAAGLPPAYTSIHTPSPLTVDSLPPQLLPRASQRRQLTQGQGFTYEVPTRTATNQLYIHELDRIVLSDKARKEGQPGLG